jgi:hypothetical protein
MLVDRLEGAGLVVRRAHPTDRRATLVELVLEPPLPRCPKLDRYHAVVAATSSRPSARAQIVAFLTDVTAHATATTQALQANARPLPKPRPGPRPDDWPCRIRL